MLVFFHIQGRFLRQHPAPNRIVDIESAPLPAPSPSPVASEPPVNPADRDNDGLTALAEYELYQPDFMPCD